MHVSYDDPSGGGTGTGTGTGNDYYTDQQKAFDAFVEDNFGHGHVDVGPVEPAAAPK